MDSTLDAVSRLWISGVVGKSVAGLGGVLPIEPSVLRTRRGWCGRGVYWSCSQGTLVMLHPGVCPSLDTVADPPFGVIAVELLAVVLLNGMPYVVGWHF